MNSLTPRRFDLSRNVELCDDDRMRPPSTQLELFSDDQGLARLGDSSEQAGDVPGAKIQLQDESKIRRNETAISMDALDAKQLSQQVSQWLEPLHLSGLSERVVVKWNSRLQTTAGRAHYSESRIELNPRLIAVADLAEIERTLKHELAHLVAYERCAKSQRRKLQPHGGEWRAACAELGIAGEARCHELALPGRRMQRRFSYACPACSEKIERVKRFKGYVSCYACCRAHSKGRYDKRFQLVETRLQP